MEPINNRRKHRRVPTDLNFSFIVDGQEHTGQIGNISLSGAFLSDPEPELSLSCLSKPGELRVPLNGDILSLKCEVVYAVGRDNEFFPVGAGVVFSNNDDTTLISVMKLATAFELD